MVDLRHIVREDDALGGDPPLECLAPKIALGQRIPEEPEHTTGNIDQQPAPKVEYLRCDLVGLSKTAEHEAIFRQTGLQSRWSRADGTVSSVRLVGSRQIGEGFAVVRGGFGRRQEAIRNEVIAEIAAQRTGVTKVVHLNRRRPIGQNRRASRRRIALQIDQDVHLVTMNRGGGLSGRQRLDVDETVERALQTAAHGFAIARTVGIGQDIKTLPIVRFQHLRHQQGGGMFVKIA